VSKTYYFEPEKLRQMAFDLFKATGSPDEEADLVSRRLLKADLTGHPSHGIIRLSLYQQMIKWGIVKPGIVPEFMKDHGATVMIEGNYAYGQVAAEHAMNIAIERAQKHGVAAVGVTNLGHVGRLADYAVSAADEGCIGIVFTACGGTTELVAPFGGKSRRMATNPFAMAFPSDRDFPVVFDMATSVYAEGKLRVMRDSGKPAPEMTIIDKDGGPTTNPDDFYDGGALLPLGGKYGYKGYLLNFMVEVLGGILTGGGYLGKEQDPGFNNCTLMIVLNVEKFRELPIFKSELEEMINHLKDTPAAEDGEVLYPGEVEARTEQERMKFGVPLADKTVEEIQKYLDLNDLPIKLAELGRTVPLG